MDKVSHFSQLANHAARRARADMCLHDLNGLTTFDTNLRHIKYFLKTAEEKHLFINLAVAAMCAWLRLSRDVAPEELVSQMTDTYRRKNADYGDAFASSLDKYGIVAALVRINDKVNRIESLTAPGREAQVKDESILDTLLDLASYAIMATMWMTEAQDEALKQIIQNEPYTI